MCEGYTYSDRLAIWYIGLRNPIIRRTNNLEKKWKMEAFDKEKRGVKALRAYSGTTVLNTEELTDTLVRACDAIMQRKLEPSCYKELCQLLERCISSRDGGDQKTKAAEVKRKLIVEEPLPKHGPMIIRLLMRKS